MDGDTLDEPTTTEPEQEPPATSDTERIHARCAELELQYADLERRYVELERRLTLCEHKDDEPTAPGSSGTPSDSAPKPKHWYFKKTHD